MHTHDPTLTRVLRSLSHPVTIGAVIVLLVNDHLLRWAWPSWWTGKLGDLAWLIFFPFILAVPLAWILPERWDRKEALTIGLAFGLTGLVFSLMNTIPAAHETGLRLIQKTTGTPFVMWIDPTDLLALPGLAVGWCVWQASNRWKRPFASQGWLILVLGALATTANHPTSPSGPDCLYVEQDGSISTTHSRGGPVYNTRDGGLTWDQTSVRDWDVEDECSQKEFPLAWVVVDPDNNLIRYRLVHSLGVYRSVDGGETWILEKDLSLTEAQIAYYKNCHNLFYFEPGPFDAIVDTQTGNLIVAMGEEGILARTVDGEWHWTEQVNRYKRPVISNPEWILSLLSVEFILAFALAFLAANAMSYVVTGVKALKLILTVLAWCGWLFTVFLSPAPTHDHGLIMVYLCPLILLLVGAGGIVGMVHINKSLGRIPREVWITSLIAPFLFILPYVIWSQGVLPRYRPALVFALLLTAANLFAGVWALRRKVGTLSI